MLRILHVSDLQCGKPFLPDAADALVRFAHAAAPDVVVASGDLTQRAKPREFKRAARLLEQLGEAPVVVTPGNHDVPMYRVWERLFAPYRNWRRYMSPHLNDVTRVDGATLVALSSAAPRRALVGGWVDATQVDFAGNAFADAPENDVRVLVIHHHFVPTASGEGGRTLPRAKPLLEAFEDMCVDLVLGGHIHQARVVFSREVVKDRPGPGIPLIASGTTTSGRGRGDERGWNSLNVIDVGPTSMEVTAHRLPPGGSEFEQAESVSVARARPTREPKAPEGRDAPEEHDAPEGQDAPDRRGTRAGRTAE